MKVFLMTVTLIITQIAFRRVLLGTFKMHRWSRKGKMSSFSIRFHFSALCKDDINWLDYSCKTIRCNCIKPSIIANQWHLSAMKVVKLMIMTKKLKYCLQKQSSIKVVLKFIGYLLKWRLLLMPENGECSNNHESIALIHVLQ